MSYDRHDYGRWGAWHRRLGFFLLGLFIALAIYFFAAGAWFGGVLTVCLVWWVAKILRG